MTIRTSLNNAGSWTQIGTGPATVQLIAPDSNQASVMVFAGASAPATNSDGLVLSSEYSVHNFNSAEPIWGQCVQAGVTALVAVQPETT